METRRALYLDSAQANRVSLEAVALKIGTHDTADLFYPLRRVARIVVTGHVEWETVALLACLDYGIPVAFRERGGRLIGHCLSDRSNHTLLESLIEQCADDVLGDALYQQWRIHEEQQWVKRVARAKQCLLRGQVASSVLPQVEYWLAAQLPCTVSLFKAQLEALIASHVTEILALYGFSDNIHVPATVRVHPARDVSRLLLLEVYVRLLQGLTVFELKDRGLRFSVVAFYEQQSGVLEERARIVLNRLWRLLKQREVD